MATRWRLCLLVTAAADASTALQDHVDCWTQTGSYMTQTKPYTTWAHDLGSSELYDFGDDDHLRCYLYAGQSRCRLSCPKGKERLCINGRIDPSCTQEPPCEENIYSVPETCAPLHDFCSSDISSTCAKRAAASDAVIDMAREDNPALGRRRWVHFHGDSTLRILYGSAVHFATKGGATASKWVGGGWVRGDPTAHLRGDLSDLSKQPTADFCYMDHRKNIDDCIQCPFCMRGVQRPAARLSFMFVTAMRFWPESAAYFFQNRQTLGILPNVASTDLPDVWITSSGPWEVVNYPIMVPKSTDDEFPIGSSYQWKMSDFQKNGPNPFDGLRNETAFAALVRRFLAGVAIAYRRAGRSPPHLIWLSVACDESMPGHHDEKCGNILPLQQIIRHEVERPEFPWAVYFEAQHSHIPRPAGYAVPQHHSLGGPCGQFNHMTHFPGMVSDQKWRLMLNLLAHLAHHRNATGRR